MGQVPSPFPTPKARHRAQVAHSGEAGQAPGAAAGCGEEGREGAARHEGPIDRRKKISPQTSWKMRLASPSKVALVQYCYCVCVKAASRMDVGPKRTQWCGGACTSKHTEGFKLRPAASPPFLSLMRSSPAVDFRLQNCCLCLGAAQAIATPSPDIKDCGGAICADARARYKLPFCSGQFALCNLSAKFRVKQVSQINTPVPS